MIPGNAQLAMVATAKVEMLLQLVDSIAAHRAVSEAVDCNAVFVHISNPPLKMARHSGRNMLATNPNSSAVAPLRSRARSLIRVIAAAL
jgi:hypothetical protein